MASIADRSIRSPVRRIHPGSICTEIVAAIGGRRLRVERRLVARDPRVVRREKDEVLRIRRIARPERLALCANLAEELAARRAEARHDVRAEPVDQRERPIARLPCRKHDISRQRGDEPGRRRAGVHPPLIDRVAVRVEERDRGARVVGEDHGERRVALESVEDRGAVTRWRARRLGRRHGGRAREDQRRENGDEGEREPGHRSSAARPPHAAGVSARDIARGALGVGSPGSRIVLGRALPSASRQWICSPSSPVTVAGAAPASHRFPRVP